MHTYSEVSPIPSTVACFQENAHRIAAVETQHLQSTSECSKLFALHYLFHLACTEQGKVFSSSNILRALQ